MSSGMRSRIYVSGAAESTPGTLVTFDKSFYPLSCNFGRKNEDTVDQAVAGYDEAVGETREHFHAAGSLVCDFNPDVLTWAFKMAFGAAPSSALVGISTTVYEHTFAAWSDTVKTFSFFKARGDISGANEKWGGNGIQKISIKGAKGRVQVAIQMKGMCANYARGTTEPTVVVVADAYISGITAELLIAGSAIGAGIMFSDFNIEIDCGCDTLDTSGSSDGSHTAFDRVGPRTGMMSFTLKETANAYLDELIAGTTYQTYEMKVYGPTIDTSIRSLCSVKFDKARLSGDINTDIGDKGAVKTLYSINSLINLSTGYGITAKTRNLTASY